MKAKSNSKKGAAKAPKLDIYQMVTDRVVAALEAGTVPWKKEWSSGNQEPRNYVSHKPYRGVNWLLLAMSGYASPEWMSYKQAADAGGQVRKGEHGTPIVFWSFFPSKTEKLANGKPKQIAFLKHYTVFNVEQIDGLPERFVPEPEKFRPIKAAEKIVASMPQRPEIRHGGGRAFYQPSTDIVQMPPKKSFTSPEAYYSTLFHELVHSTGHADRLSRAGIIKMDEFGSDQYGKEELVAELGAAFLNAHAGIDSVFDNSASYLASWIKAIKGDNKLVLGAAGQAQKATDFILDYHYEEAAVAA